jgi:hypothetical protein
MSASHTAGKLLHERFQSIQCADRAEVPDLDDAQLASVEIVIRERLSSTTKHLTEERDLTRYRSGDRRPQPLCRVSRVQVGEGDAGEWWAAAFGDAPLRDESRSPKRTIP